jgi:Flp pilus assembly protein TadG
VIARIRAARAGGDDRDRGAATIFVIGFSVMLLVVAGLVVDGGLAINARANASDIAEQAARAGARQIDEGRLRESGEVTIDQAAAREQAGTFLNQALKGNGSTSISFPSGDEVQVTIQNRRVETALLGLIGIDQFTINTNATARAAVGIENEIP